MSATETEKYTSVLVKLHRVATAITNIEKRGHNKHHKYDFVQAVDVVRQVRDLLLAEKVFVIPAAGNAQHLPYGDKGAHLTTVDLCYRFVDIETGDEVSVPWIGVGADTGGDKGIYKAYTGGLKYALLNLFLVPTGDDPENDRTTESGQDSKEHKDDQRPVAPRIPVDRAQAILDKAFQVRLATVDGDGTPVLFPVFQAVLAQQGVEKIGALNVDQAEAVEAFLALEAKS